VNEWLQIEIKKQKRKKKKEMLKAMRDDSGKKGRDSALPLSKGNIKKEEEPQNLGQKIQISHPFHVVVFLAYLEGEARGTYCRGRWG